jgi:anti-sigma factor RsiW
MSEVRLNCAKVRELLEPYFEGVLSEAQERLVGEHLWQCHECAAELEQVQRMALALAGLPRMAPTEELLRAISSSLDALPTPVQRRLRIGWKRLGLAAALSLIFVAATSYLLALAFPVVLTTAKPAVGFLAHQGHLFSLWVGRNYHLFLTMGGALRGLLPAVRTLAVASAPMFACYAIGELFLVAAAAYVIRSLHRRVAAPSQVARGGSR